MADCCSTPAREAAPTDCLRWEPTAAAWILGPGRRLFTHLGTVAFTGSGPRTFTLGGDNAGGNLCRQVIADGPGGPTSLLKADPATGCSTASILWWRHDHQRRRSGHRQRQRSGSVPSSPATNIAFFRHNGTLRANAAVIFRGEPQYRHHQWRRRQLRHRRQLDERRRHRHRRRALSTRPARNTCDRRRTTSQRAVR